VNGTLFTYKCTTVNKIFVCLSFHVSVRNIALILIPVFTLSPYKAYKSFVFVNIVIMKCLALACTEKLTSSLRHDLPSLH